MDYIIFGTGSSATLVLLGWLLRDWGPRIRDRRPAEDDILSASDLVKRMAWARFCATCGMAILLCGVLIMLATLGAAFFAASDRAATIAVVATFGLAIGLMLAWTALYLRQFGAIGIIRPREKREAPEPVDTPVPVVAAEAGPGASTPDQPAPSFAETAASRGGLGRFAAFFRRDTNQGPDAVQDPAGESVLANAPTQPDATAAPDPGTPEVVPSPTEAVIAELAGSADDDEKRLSPDDALVISVHGIPANRSVEDAVVSEVLGPDHAPASEDRDDPHDDNPAAVQSDRELALAQLRRRRLSRLSNPSDPD